CSPVFQFAVLVTSLYGLKKICAEAVALHSVTRTTAKIAAAHVEKANCERVLLQKIITLFSFGIFW
ncbi:MAG: hypothetical protein ABSE51_23785, partial [Terracidiphilus sp.]